MNKKQVIKLTPLLLGFFIMGFIDLVGISTSRMKIDFNLTDTISNLMPFVLFSMFFIFSIPTSLLMNKIGRKKTVLFSYFLTTIALFIPIIIYSFISSLVCFALLGIANAILQVSLNPLLASSVREDNKACSLLTAGQFIKAMASFCIPILSSFLAIKFGDWKIIFIIFAVTTIISASLLYSITESDKDISCSNIANINIKIILDLFKNKIIILLFFGIICVVGIDVGMSIVIPKILMEYNAVDINTASYGSSFYFAGRIIGMFLGIILLLKIKSTNIFLNSVIVTLISLIALLFIRDWNILLIIFCIIGLSVANIFPVILSIAIKNEPKKMNNISGLMITGVGGGAIIPILMGISSDMYGSQIGSLFILLLATIYLLTCVIILKQSYKQ